MDRFFLSIIHRPELVPEYLDREARTGKLETVGKKEVVTESLDIFGLQQKIAHGLGFRTTIQMTYASLYNQEAIDLAKEHHARYGDEISLTFLGLNCKEFRARFHSKELAMWLFSMEDKRAIVDALFARFYEVFGFYPTSTGCYYMDAELVSYIKARFPMIKTAVATCFEEGPRVYHNCNHSWYTLLDGGPWMPWIPSRRNIHCPASDEEDDIGIVAIPHLTRDLLAPIDSPGLWFGTHPQNILRSLAYDGFEYPYMYNLIDHYAVLRKYNRGYTYNMVFVGPGWMSKSGRWEAKYEILVKSYEDCLAYYAELRGKGRLEDVTMSEFADWFRANKTYHEPTCALWKDILFGTQKQVFWYLDPYYRICLDMNQGGALIDLRPYAAKLVRPVGVGTKCLQDASYPFIIQSHYRAGYFTHYAGEGVIKSCKVSFRGEEVDLCTCRTKAAYGENGKERILTLDPVEIEFAGLTISLVTTYTFTEGTGVLQISRRIVDASDPEAELTVNEYFTGCYGTNEYPQDLAGVTLRCVAPQGTEELQYAYKCREIYLDGAQSVEAVIPQVESKVTVSALSGCAQGYVREGYAFCPNFTLGLKQNLRRGEEMRTCLRVEKAG